MKRLAELKRKTAETDIALTLALDGKGEGKIDTGCPFLDHMLTLFAKHGRFDINVSCKGDTEVDYHHTVEDVGIVLGQAFASALGDKAGITRYGDTTLPMDEAHIVSPCSVSGGAPRVFSIIAQPARLLQSAGAFFYKKARRVILAFRFCL